MDDSAVFQSMLDKAIKIEPSGFVSFDRTKNVQDQLQEMVYDEDGGLGILFDKFVHWAFLITAENIDESSWIRETWKSKTPLTSMERLWLDFVMHEKYGKVWNGTDWVLQ